MLDITGRFADGWWPAGAWTPEQYADKLVVIRAAADKAGRDPEAIVPAFIQTCLIADDDAELAEIVAAPLVKSILLQLSAAELRKFGYDHPMGERWGGFVDMDPALLTRERILAFCAAVTPDMVLDLLPHGTPRKVAKRVKAFCDAGLRVPKILDYGGMSGMAYGAKSPAKVRAAEDELLRLCAGD
jgi:phthiodiolone/phenolphthiodiolone dimycocerosates ketoreductase